MLYMLLSAAKLVSNLVLIIGRTRERMYKLQRGTFIISEKKQTNPPFGFNKIRQL